MPKNSSSSRKSKKLSCRPSTPASFSFRNWSTTLLGRVDDADIAADEAVGILRIPAFPGLRIRVWRLEALRRALVAMGDDPVGKLPGLLFCRPADDHRIEQGAHRASDVLAASLTLLVWAGSDCSALSISAPVGLVMKTMSE